MFEKFYNLQTNPFHLNPDPAFCFYHRSFRKARAYLEYALLRGEDIVLIYGKPGTGKTMLLKDTLVEYDDTFNTIARLITTQFSVNDLLPLVAYAFGLSTESSHRAQISYLLYTHLCSLQDDGQHAVLIVDEAQALSNAALEELRLLTNMEQHNRPLLQLILVGQPQLHNRLFGDDMEQLGQRVVAACHIEPICESDVPGYINTRLRAAGWCNDPEFDSDIYPLLHRFTEGIPRRINQICNRLLLYGCSNNIHYIDNRDFLAVIKELWQEELLPTGVMTKSNREIIAAQSPDLNLEHDSVSKAG